MADVANSVGSNVFKSFGATTKIPVQKQIQQTQPQPVTVPVKTETPAAKSKLEKAMPYIATGVSVAAVGVATAVAVKSGKRTKTLLKKIEQLERNIAAGTGTPVNKETLKNTTSFLVGILGAATGGAIVNHFDTNKETLKNIGMSDDEINASKAKAESAAYERENKITKVENTANDAVRRANEAEGKAQNAENKAGAIENKANQALGTANDALSRANAVINANGISMSIHRKPHYGLNLLVINNDQKYVNIEKRDKALTDIHTAVTYRNGRKPGETENLITAYRKKYVPLMKSNSTWSLTAEFDPIKAGGLGSVPMEIQNNFADMGIDNPVFIPMYQHKGNSELIEYGNDKEGKKYKYIYDKDVFDVEKMAEMPVQQYRGNKVINQNVEFYLGHAKRGGKANPDQPIVFVKNTDNFGGDIYANGFNADEPEKFAFFSKAVYQLAEAKVSQALGDKKTGLGEMKIINKEAYEAVKPPVAMMLNDWHAAPMAGLLRYKAPMENAYNVISDNAKEALRDMPCVMVGHNAGIPGSTRSNSEERSDMLTENIINTLYDGFALGITENAYTGRGPEAVSNAVLWERNNNGDRQFNNLAHGIALSDFYVPVSRNYEKELKEDKQASTIALDIITARKDTGSIVGIVNGLDRDMSSTEAKAGWLKNAFNIKLQTYNHYTPIDKVMKARQHNKMELFDNYITPIKDGERTLGGKPLNVVGSPMNVTREDFEKAPLLCFAHRLTSQKGLDAFQKAVKEVFDTWDEKHPGQPKPVIIAGGQLEEGKQKHFLNELKKPDNYKDKNDVNRILVLEGFMPNPALMAAATYFVAPSRFEPCGLTQGECYAMGTPVIATKTGGFVDTIVDGKNGYVADYSSYHEEVERKGSDYDAWLAKTGHSLANKMNEGLDTYFNKPDTYKQIVENNLNENLSWNTGKENDPIHNHMSKLCINQEDIIEAEVAPVRQFIVPILKEFDNLQNGEISAKAFEDKTKILPKEGETRSPLADNVENVFEKFEKINNKKQDTINDIIENINSKVVDVNNKERLGQLNMTEDFKKAMFEKLELKKNMEKSKLDIVTSSSDVAKRDREMFDRLVNAYYDSKAPGKKFDLNTKEFEDVNAWKKDLCTRYSA